MANSTVYPYGTGGSLPASIGIINDYSTGGADKAWSAEQGKNVGQSVYGVESDIETELTPWTTERPETSSTLRIFYYNANQLKGGEVIRVKLNDYENYKFAVVVTTLSTAPGSTIKYDSGWQQADFEYTIPASLRDYYLRITYATAAGNTAIGDEVPDQITTERKLLQITKASIGLEAAARLKDYYQYLGEKIAIDNRFTSEELFQMITVANSRAKQGGAAYDGYLFQFHNYNADILMYRISDGTLIQDISLTANANNHAGSGGFGVEKSDSSDPFPLLYISSMDEKKIYVYRLSGTIGSLTITLVQTITLPSSGLMYLPNVAVDRENKKLVVFGYSANSWSSPTDNVSLVTSCPIPALSQGDVTLTVSDFSDVHELPWIYAEQGAFAQGGKLYLSYGNTGAGLEIGGIFSIDYLAGAVLSEVDLSVLGGLEPEALVRNGNFIIMTTQDRYVYQLTF